MERLIRVVIPTSGAVLDVRGRRAELVALVAASDLSERSLGLLLHLVACEPTIAALVYGGLEVDLTPVRAKVYERRHVDRRKPLSLEDADVA